MCVFGLSVPGHSIGSHLQFYLVIKVSYTKQSANVVQIIEIDFIIGKMFIVML